MAPLKQQQQQQQHQTAVTLNREIKHRVLTCLGKLADRDTHSAAAVELESIARTLSHDAIPPFLSSISSTDAADKSPVRKQCVRLISLLSEAHGDALAPYLSKLLSAVVRRLRDSDSSVRSACVAAISSISSHIVKPPFSSIIKPLIDALVTEQDQNSQISAAMCLTAAIEASPDPEPIYLKKFLPRLEKLLKCESFKAKPALLALVGSVIGTGAASSQQTLKNLVPCLVDFISSEDWAARKSAAEALVQLAVGQNEILAEFKNPALKKFETRRYDKVKSVRETMNQLVEVWKEIPDNTGDEESSPPADPLSSSKENARTSVGAAQLGRRSSVPQNKQPESDASIVTTARKRSPLDSNDKKAGQAIFRKLEHKRVNDWKSESTVAAPPHAALSSSIVASYEDHPIGRDEIGKPEVRRALFNNKETNESIIKPNTQDICRSKKEQEDLTQIRQQLVQIESQQSNLLDLLQRFIGSSENGMRSLENRVHGLELSLDEISFDLATSTGRMSKIEAKKNSSMFCNLLPGTAFLSSKLWRRTETHHQQQQQHQQHQHSISRFLASSAISQQKSSRGNNAETPQGCDGGGGFIVNPLAAFGASEYSSSHVISRRVNQLK
ncbi:TORTIFOLIA1-like protein 4 [Impatiens glandulifera]|uniref:TORTIFOLIA1-like protein 4 n=1 Tax=Impatiens glandulifera TaxID=253017 RepID=UPI001FB12297|nr:TORTIFOLIA1-like protein 4 [Impatiens glandulifera]